MGRVYINSSGKIKKKTAHGKMNLKQLIELTKHKKYITLSKNQVLFRENDPIKGVYFLISGKIEITKVNSDNTQSILYTIKSPGIIGLHSIMEEDFHIHTAKATSGSLICFMAKQEFEKIVSQNSELAFNIMKMLCLQISFIQNQIYKHT
jgi:CRP-like cAMP-binding protein